MPAITTAEALRASGFSEDQIKALDAKMLGVFDTMTQKANADREAAELAQRAQQQKWETEISPALDNWGNKEANLTAERDYYKTLAEKAKTGGFVTDVPPFKPAENGQRGNDGRFVANNNEVPGSPKLQEIETGVANAFGMVADAQHNYRTLFGGEMPDAPTTLMREAEAARLPFNVYVNKKYDFDSQREKKAKEKRAAEDANLVKETTDKLTREFAERNSSNGDLRPGEPSRFTDIHRAVTKNERPDPLKMDKGERHANSRKFIHQEIAEQATA
jgi:hypothetical protein